jgi:hypothetical protein
MGYRVAFDATKALLALLTAPSTVWNLVPDNFSKTATEVPSGQAVIIEMELAPKELKSTYDTKKCVKSPCLAWYSFEIVWSTIVGLGV